MKESKLFVTHKSVVKWLDFVSPIARSAYSSLVMLKVQCCLQFAGGVKGTMLLTVR